MTYELAHRTRDSSDAEGVTVTASTSWDAVEQLRGRIPAEHVILYVRPLA